MLLKEVDLRLELPVIGPEVISLQEGKVGPPRSMQHVLIVPLPSLAHILLPEKEVEVRTAQAPLEEAQDIPGPIS